MSAEQDQQKALSIAMVGYLNTVPLVHGLKASSEQKYDLNLLIPADCYQAFSAGEADVALLPVGTLPLLPRARIITDYCIGCKDHVRTVCLLSDTNISEVKTVYLDLHSRTSVLLTRVLFAHLWRQEVDFVPRDVATLQASDLSHGEAALMIGDKVFEVEGSFRYTYDLGHEWKRLTGLPFAFAVWVANPVVTHEQIRILNQDLARGIAETDIALQDYGAIDEAFDLRAYFSTHIDYHLDSHKRQAIELFLTHIKGLPNPTF